MKYPSLAAARRRTTPLASAAFAALCLPLAAAAQTAPTTADAALPEVRVKGSATTASPVKADQASVTRSGASILDTPMTVSVIPEETAENQAAQTIGDVVRNVAGVRPATYFGTYESVYARGFWLTTTSNHFRNGFRFVHLVQPAKRNVERYELIKGPMALDYGRVEPGALLNIVTKKPQAETFREVTLSAGEYGGWDVGFDLTGKLDESGTLLYRLNGGTGRQAFVASEVRPEQDDLAGALTWKLSPDTRLDFDFEISQRDQLIYPGLPVPDPLDARSADDVPVRNFYGEPDGRFEGDFKLFTARVNHRLSERWSIDFGYSKNVTERDVKQIRLNGVSGDTVLRGANPFSQEFDVDTLQAELKGDLRVAGMRHRITLTADRAAYDRTGSNNNLGTVDPIDLNDPEPTGATFDYGPESTSEVTDTGLALQDYVEVNRYLNVLAGVRYSRYRETNPDVPVQKGNSTDPTLAVIVKPSDDVSVYVSYARSFSPNSGTLTAPNTYAPPSEGKQWEVGTKAEWLDGALRTQIAYFDLEKTNVPTPSANPEFSDVSGEQRSRGVELEAVGALTPRWNLIANYAVIDAEITRDNVAANVGNQAAQTPRNSGSLWTTYRLAEGAAGWTVGGGLFYTGDKFVATNNLVRVPSYTVVDAMASYQFASILPGARLQFNVRNLFDKRFYEGGSSNAAGFTALYPGLPRTLSASLAVPF